MFQVKHTINEVHDVIKRLTAWKHNREMGGYDVADLNNALACLYGYQKLIDELNKLRISMEAEMSPNQRVTIHDAGGQTGTPKRYRVKKELDKIAERSRYRDYRVRVSP